MTNNILLKISKFFLYLVPLTAVIVYQGTLFPFIVGKYVFFRTTVGLALIFYLFHWAWEKRNKIPNSKFQKEKPSANNCRSFFSPLVIAVSVFILMFLLAGFFGYNPAASFWSNFERGEGGFQLLNLFIFFVLLVLTFKDEKSWRRLFIIAISAALLVITYGVFGALGIGNFIGSSLCQRFAGSIGNAAYTGTYMIFAMFYAAYSVSESKGKIKKWFLIGFVILFFVFLLLTQTRGAVLGLAVAILAGLFYLLFTSPSSRWRYILSALIVFLITSGILGIIYWRSINLMPFCQGEAGGGNRILNISFSTENYQTRLSLWRESIKAFEERPLLGWGPENFTTAFEEHYDPKLYDASLNLNQSQPPPQTWFDRAHSIFFDYLVMTGALGFLSFLGIFAVLFWQFFKFNLRPTTNDQRQIISDKKSLVVGRRSLVSNALLFALPIAYLVQGLVLFDVLPIYLNLFLFLAFINYKFGSESAKPQS